MPSTMTEMMKVRKFSCRSERRRVSGRMNKKYAAAAAAAKKR